MKRALGAASTLSSAPWMASPPAAESGRRVRVEPRSGPVTTGTPLTVGLAFVGGILGGTVGGGTLVVDQRIASAGAPAWITCLAIVSVTVCAVAAFMGALWFVHTAVRRAAITSSDT